LYFSYKNITLTRNVLQVGSISCAYVYHNSSLISVISVILEMT